MTYTNDVEDGSIETPPPSFFFQKKKDGTASGVFIPALMGAYLASKTAFRLHPSGVLWRYDPSGVFLPDNRGVGQSVVDLLGDRWQSRHAAETMVWLATDAPPLPAPDPRYVNVANGMLDWQTGALLPHAPAHGSITQVPWPWDPSADCPRLRSTFAHLPEGMMDLIYEIAGYLLVPANNRMKLAVLLHGPASTGKSTLLDCLTSLVGAANTSALTLHDLAGSRFASAELHGKLANICGDLDSGEVTRSDTFKRLVGGDEIAAERKHGQPFKFTNTAKLVFSANALPPTRDSTDAWFTRFLILPFLHRPDEIDFSIKAELPRDRDEMTGFLRHAVEGLRRLVERGRFDPPAVVVEAGREYRAEADSVRSFFGDDEMWALDASASTARTPAYRRYASWCRITNRRPVRDTEFYRRILADGLDLGLGLRMVRGERQITGARPTGAAHIEIDERLGF